MDMPTYSILRIHNTQIEVFAVYQSKDDAADQLKALRMCGEEALLVPVDQIAIYEAA